MQINWREPAPKQMLRRRPEQPNYIILASVMWRDMGLRPIASGVDGGYNYYSGRTNISMESEVGRNVTLILGLSCSGVFTDINNFAINYSKLFSFRFVSGMSLRLKVCLKVGRLGHE